MIERYHLRYFLAVVDAGTFSRGAAQVSVTQPALSTAIAKLEQHLGARLFHRNSQRVQLTDAGVRLLAHARMIESEFHLLDERLSPADQPQILRIGILTTIPSQVIEQALEKIRSSCIHQPIEIVDGNERELSARLQRRRIDIALTIIRPAEARFMSEPLFTEGYSMIGHARHPALQQRLVGGEALAREPMIVRRQCEVLAETSRYFIERGVRPRFSYRSMNDERVLAMVRCGLGITLVPDSYVTPELGHSKLSGFEFTRTIGMAFATHGATSAQPAVLDGLRSLRNSIE